jgi:hypothetical protein
LLCAHISHPHFRVCATATWRDELNWANEHRRFALTKEFDGIGEAARELITERSLYEGEPDGVIVPLAIALDTDRQQLFRKHDAPSCARCDKSQLSSDRTGGRSCGAGSSLSASGPGASVCGAEAGTGFAGVADGAAGFAVGSDGITLSHVGEVRLPLSGPRKFFDSYAYRLPIGHI